MKKLLVAAAWLPCLIPLLLPVLARAEEEKRNTLSIHETIARFDGTQFTPCMYKTALCPDKCGHSKTVAWFTVLRYEKYQKPGQYGDEKTERFCTPISGPITPEMDPTRAEIVLKLKPGAWVRLNWVHEYVHKEGMSYPERVVTRLDPIPEAEVQALRKDIVEPPARTIEPSRVAPAARAGVSAR